MTSACERFVTYVDILYNAPFDYLSHWQAIRQSPPLISVSKLCCPVCWNFFQVLKNEHSASEPMVRGSHSNLFAVSLPVWTPPAIREKMEETFLRFLRTELIGMVNPPAVIPTSVSLRHRHNMSDSLYTEASTNVGETPEFFSGHGG